MPTFNIQRHVSLKPYNTLSVEVVAKHFISITDSAQIPGLITYASRLDLSVLVLGGGSNVVFTRDYEGLVIHLKSTGIATEIIGDDVLLTAQAGENWHELVMSTLHQKIYGLENLALIPGNIGAAAIQNIGAYGVELKNIFYSLRGWNIKENTWQTLTLEDCQFAYRDSVFKQNLKDAFVISEVTLKLSRNPRVNLSYQVLKEFLGPITDPTPLEVARAVIQIRSQKLPSPELTPNAGSFFKNPVITIGELESIKKRYPKVVYFASGSSHVKLAAGWLIEQLGWKGKVVNNVSMHAQQSLVLINQGASGSQLVAHAEAVREDVLQHFGVHLEIEPRIY